jgi:hypothetical protein
MQQYQKKHRNGNTEAITLVWDVVRHSPARKQTGILVRKLSIFSPSVYTHKTRGYIKPNTVIGKTEQKQQLPWYCDIKRNGPKTAKRENGPRRGNRHPEASESVLNALH